MRQLTHFDPAVGQISVRLLVYIGPMSVHSELAFFNNQQIRRHWDQQRELWWFSVIDVVQALTDQNDYQKVRKYWNKLAERLRLEGNESVTKCHRLKMLANDGKRYLTDCADTETMLRLIQSIPSPKAEPLKLWLAQVGYERLEETADPELAFDRAMQTYLRKGYSKAWINQRLKSIEVRKELTDEWQARGVRSPSAFAILTDDITRAWAGRSVKEYKQLKGLKKESLRDNMTNLEIVLNMLGEASSTEISKVKQPETFASNRSVARQGGGVAAVARRAIEEQTGQSVVTAGNERKLASGKSNR